jgi:hypothetical protein
MTVEIKKTNSGEWNIIHTHEWFVKIMTLDSEEIGELIKKFKDVGF